MNLRRPIATAASCLVLTACASLPPAAPAPAAAPPVVASTDAGRQLHELFERYFEDALRRNPLLATYVGDHRYDDQLPNSIGPAFRAEAQAANERFLAEARAIDVARLSPPDRVSHEIFVRQREREGAAGRFPLHLLPVNQTDGLLIEMPSLGSGTGAQPFGTVRDYENWLGRLDGLVVWMDQAIANMREGVARGVVQPRPVMEKVLPQLEAMIVEEPSASAYFDPVRGFPPGIAPAEHARLADAYAAKIRDELVPAYRRLRDFVRDEYLPHTRTTVAWSALPDGAAWYAHLVREHTTVDLTAAEINALGLREVSRILGEMDGVRRAVGFEGDLQAFFAFLETDPRFYYTSGADLLQGFRELKARINAALPRLFSLFPRADYEVRGIEAFQAPSAAGAYYQQPSADGSRPGIFYVNTYNLKAQPKFGMETLSLHEAAPGHHFQTAIQQELAGLPRFRRFMTDFTAYSEGWALYAESLGRELGLFADPYHWFGRLNDEQLRAMRLVVDTGLHALGWTREQAIRYMLDNSTLAPSDVESEVERYIASPGQALGYKVGDLRMQALRRRAQAALGERFDVREFHRQVLGDGALPLDVLEAKIERWIAGQAVAPQAAVQEERSDG